MSDRLAHGAIEVGIVGDVNEDKAIASVARTLGALPAREPEFQPYADRRTRPSPPTMPCAWCAMKGRRTSRWSISSG
jgi:hypothetical protein